VRCSIWAFDRGSACASSANGVVLPHAKLATAVQRFNGIAAVPVARGTFGSVTPPRSNPTGQAGYSRNGPISLLVRITVMADPRFYEWYRKRGRTIPPPLHIQHRSGHVQITDQVLPIGHKLGIDNDGTKTIGGHLE
jgi:hypothetical protein